jgi:D-beta-D-heptose 7-phosphate kinase/D-beta-D-heptose 1-phosphate adenosyltransferase
MALKQRSQMNNLLQKIRHLKMLVVGDCMLDHYIFGDVHRISPEAPVPVVNVERETYRLGGACNVAINVRQLGAQVELVGWVGQDKAGMQVGQLLQDARIAFPEACTQSTIETIVKTRVVVRNQQLCRLDRESEFPLKWVDELNILIAERIRDVDGVIVSDYSKGSVAQSVFDHLIQLKRRKNFFLAVDPKPVRELLYQDVDLLTPNRTEALQLASLETKHLKLFPLKDVIARIQAVHATRYLGITLGEEGIVMVDPERRTELFPTLAKEVFDVSGAGDTAIAALTLALCAEEDVTQAAYFANIAAGIVVGKVGTATVSAQEILSYAESLSV